MIAKLKPKRKTEPVHLVEYRYTDESLLAIMHGLDITKGDRVLAICGSGDQAFAMLEVADSVVAFDCNEDQIEFVRYRMGLLREGNFNGFLYAGRKDIPSYRREYFTERRCETLRGRLGRLELELANLYALPPNLNKSRFTKMYLSNAWCHSAGCSEYFIPDKDIPSPKVLSMVLCSLHAGGLVYVSRRGVFELDIGAEIPLALQRNLTAVATSYEAMGTHDFWDPAVFRKTY